MIILPVSLLREREVGRALRLARCVQPLASLLPRNFTPISAWDFFAPISARQLRNYRRRGRRASAPRDGYSFYSLILQRRLNPVTSPRRGKLDCCFSPFYLTNLRSLTRMHRAKLVQILKRGEQTCARDAN